MPHGVDGEPTVPDNVAAEFARDPRAALAEAQRLLDEDRPFHAHEVLEAVWKSAPDGEREMWRGLAQVAVGVTHLRRGNPTGARALLTRAADRLVADPAAGTPYGLDLRRLAADVRAISDRIEQRAADPLPTRLVLVPVPGSGR
jgi:predicted metal-dependent hydrolase